MAVFDSSPMFGAPRTKTVVVPELPAPAKLYARALTGVAKHFQRNRPTDLPALRFVRPAVTLDSVAIERYARVCGFFPEQGIPFTYPHLLAFPLHLLLLTDPAFPWPALGIVHLANSVHMRRPLSFDDTLRVEVEFGARLRHDKGQAFVMQTRVYRRGEAVWDGDSIYLKRGVAASGDPLSPLQTASGTLARASRWQLPSQLGRDYAKASGDYNPIHLTMLSAKAFGFPRAIAHGMWTLARACAALQPPKRLADATLAGEFKAPLLLPGDASLWTSAPSPTSREFEVRDPEGGKPHLRGRFQWNLQ
ncbi:acyl dehydratase [Paraburkholderia sp. LEh10]|uniref:MaoC/PaaZ C-terminal domain-containing protein n=1 Tax=Paraburkholderia sp. LEh10 TaxID=2821353 RepID=UPI001AEB5BDF|nr:MaoC/PaaZ C-terminal domain-containing protein [Paraburkholderia sp. LEh10]MBP0589053.1 acyl dehydratase [Paraburkholderia sp. LEh10]